MHPDFDAKQKQQEPTIEDAEKVNEDEFPNLAKVVRD